MKVSIITVTLNSEKYLEKTILSVLNQTYSNIEYIIIDGGSKDGTLNLISKYQDSISYFISEKDDGIYDAMNKGITQATGDLIGIINSDDWLNNDAIERIVSVGKKAKTKTFVIHGNIRMINANNKILAIRKPIANSIAKYFTTPFKHPAMFVSKEIYKTFGAFDIGSGLAADYDFMLRISSCESFYIDKIITNVRTVGISTGGRKSATSYELLNILLKNTKNPILSFLGIIYRRFRKLIL